MARLVATLLTLALAWSVSGCTRSGARPVNSPASAAPGATTGGATTGGATTGGATTGGTPAAAPAGASRPQPVPGRVMLGTYVALAGQTQGESLALRRQQIGRDQRIIHQYYRWEDELPRTQPESAGDSLLLVSWRGTSYARINNGSQDARIVANAKRIAAYGRPVFLRWGWEMNGDWFAWTGAQNNRDTAGYIAAWRRIHDIFTANGVTNAAWVWIPNYNANPAADWNQAARYYPGDDYVDWVGVDGFNLNGESVESLFGPLYAEYGERKPFMIAETSVVDSRPEAKAAWIDELTAWVIDHPRVAAVVWFDTNTHEGGARDFRVDSAPAALAAYQRLAQNPYFSG